MTIASPIIMPYFIFCQGAILKKKGQHLLLSPNPDYIII